MMSIKWVVAGTVAEFKYWAVDRGMILHSHTHLEYRDPTKDIVYRYLRDPDRLRGISRDVGEAVKVIALPGFYERKDCVEFCNLLIGALIEREQCRRGPVVVLEGPDGAGKTTVAHAVEKGLEALGFRTTYTRMPGGTRIGELLRGPLKDASFEMSPLVKTLLFAAVDQASSEHIDSLSMRGAVVVDRSALSNLAYRIAQEEEDCTALLYSMFGLRLDEDGTAMQRGGGEGHSWTPLSLVPMEGQLYLLDAPDEVLQARIMADRGPVGVAADRFDGLWKKAAVAYRAFAHCPAFGATVIDSSHSVSEVSAEIVEHTVKRWFARYFAEEP